jgi:acetyltransferase-like isoleucine patch superfamily enzyme
MKISKLLRVLLLPAGLVVKLIELANNGARNLENKQRFKGACIDKGCCININSLIAPYTHLLSNSIINNTTIASYSYIGKDCKVQNAIIGSFCSIADGVLIGLGKHPQHLFSTSTILYRKSNTLEVELIDEDLVFEEYENITIGNDVWIGTRAIILDGTKIGHGAIVAANSVVTKDIPPYAIVAGIPAKVIKYRFEQDKIEKLLKLEWWNWPLKEIKLRLNELYNI